AQVRWTGPSIPSWGGRPRANPDDLQYSPDGRVLIAYSALHAEWEFIDTRTGESLKTIRLFEPGAEVYNVDPLTSLDRRRLLIWASFPDPPSLLDSDWLKWTRGWVTPPGKQCALTVLHDLNTGKELMRLKIQGIVHSHLAPDGTIVLTDKWRVWEGLP